MKFPGRFQLVQLVFCFNYIFFIANINTRGRVICYQYFLFSFVLLTEDYIVFLQLLFLLKIRKN